MIDKRLTVGGEVERIAWNVDISPHTTKVVFFGKGKGATFVSSVADLVIIICERV